MEHVPVLLTETLDGLALFPGSTAIDGTVGGGGHAASILNKTAPDGRLLGLDIDLAAVERVREQLAPYGERFEAAHRSFRDIAAVANEHRFESVQAILLDLGVSSFQLAEEQRGFSFMREGPLDMRLDQSSDLTAAEIVNGWETDEIADIIYRFGEEPRSRRIARAIVAARPVQDTLHLATVVQRAVGGRGHHRIHPATRVFQALRIEVNDELGALKDALQQGIELLASGGRIAVITFHSLEDRIVKQFMQRESRDCICPPELPVCQCEHRASLRVVTGRPIRPTEDEIKRNPRSRSAKLRVAARL